MGAHGFVGPQICTVVDARRAPLVSISRDAERRITGRVQGFPRWRPRRSGRSCGRHVGFFRQLDGASRTEVTRLGLVAGATSRWWPICTPRCEVPGKQKLGAAYGYTKELGYHPLLAARAVDRRGCWRPWVANRRCSAPAGPRGRGVVQASSTSSPRTCDASRDLPGRPRSRRLGIRSRKLIDRRHAHGARWSITVTLGSADAQRSQAIPRPGPTSGLHQRRPRCIVAVTELHHRTRGKAKPPSASSWPHPPPDTHNDWARGDTTHSCANPDRHRRRGEFHRAHAVVGSPSAGSKWHTRTRPDYGANCAPLRCAVRLTTSGPWPSIAGRRRPRTYDNALADSSTNAVLANRIRPTDPAIPGWPGKPIPAHTQRTLGPGALRLTRTSPERPHGQRRQRTTPAPLARSTPYTPTTPPTTRAPPQTATDPTNPASPKANRWIQA